MSLGVFLFGYDQGVMSGIITSVFLSKEPGPWLDPCWGAMLMSVLIEV